MTYCIDWDRPGERDRDDVCAFCGGPQAIRFPVSDKCDHLYWPDNLTDEAKRANGFEPQTVTQWVKR